MWFKKNKKEKVNETVRKKDEEMSKMIDEVLNEQAQAREEAMRESATAEGLTPDETAKPKLTDLIVKFRENQNQETFGAVLTALFPSTLLVTMTPVEGSENKEEKTKRFAPAFVKDNDGNRLLPAFSDKEQLKEEAKQFTAIAMPFGEMCAFVSRIPDCERIIINPFTAPFVVGKDVIEGTAKAVAMQRKKAESK